VGSPAARVIRAGRIDRAVAFLDIRDLAFLVDDERGAVRHAGVFVENAVSGRRLALGKIAQERNGDVVLRREFPLRRNVVGADSKNLDALLFKFGDTILVRFEFLRSTTGERSRVERQDDRVFAAEIREFDPSALAGRQIEVRGHIADLEMGLGRRNGLAEQARRGEESERRE
jgi:hypothetical protein